MNTYKVAAKSVTTKRHFLHNIILQSQSISSTVSQTIDKPHTQSSTLWGDLRVLSSGTQQQLTSRHNKSLCIRSHKQIERYKSCNKAKTICLSYISFARIHNYHPPQNRLTWIDKKTLSFKHTSSQYNQSLSLPSISHKYPSNNVVSYESS